MLVVAAVLFVDGYALGRLAAGDRTPGPETAVVAVSAVILLVLSIDTLRRWLR